VFHFQFIHHLLHVRHLFRESRGRVLRKCAAPNENVRAIRSGNAAAEDGFQVVKLQSPNKGHRVQSLLNSIQDTAAGISNPKSKQGRSVAKSVETCIAHDSLA
jgi:hypothetical protein